MAQYEATKVAVSPDSTIIATSLPEKQVVLRDAFGRLITRLDIALSINSLVFSRDTRYLAISTDEKVFLCSLLSDHHLTVLEPGSAGVFSADFSPMGETLVLVGQLSLGLTFWDLDSGMGFPVLPCCKSPQHVTFTSDDQIAAVCSRQRGIDYIHVYLFEGPKAGWVSVRRFQVQGIRDCSRIFFTPNDQAIVAVDSDLDFALAVFQPDGHLIGQFSKQSPALGITTSLVFSPLSEWACFGTLDGDMCQVNTLTWSLFSSRSLQDDRQSCKTVKRVGDEVVLGSLDDLGAVSSTTKGVYHVSFSPNGRYVVGLCGSLPRVVHLFDASSQPTHLALVLLIVLPDRVMDVFWSGDDQLVMCDGGDQLVVWDPQEVVVLPPVLSGFSIRKMDGDKGTRVVLSGFKRMVIYDIEEKRLI